MTTIDPAARVRKLERDRLWWMLATAVIAILGVLKIADVTSGDVAGSRLMIALGWTLMMLGVATYFWELIAARIEMLEAPSPEVRVSDASLLSVVAEIYKTGPFNRVLMITGLVLILSGGVKANWLDLPTLSISIGSTADQDAAPSPATPQPEKGEGIPSD